MDLALGILIGAVGTFLLCYAAFLWVSSSVSKRGERLHDEAMLWHKKSLDALNMRNRLTDDIIGVLKEIRGKLK